MLIGLVSQINGTYVKSIKIWNTASVCCICQERNFDFESLGAVLHSLGLPRASTDFQDLFLVYTEASLHHLGKQKMSSEYVNV